MSEDRILASDAEREVAALALRRHLEEGRLSIEEFGERVGSVYEARTRAQLVGAQRDLPVLETPPATGDRLPLRRQRVAGVLRWSTPSLGAVGIWAAAGRHGSFWPVWVMLVSGGLGLRSFSRRHRSPGQRIS